MDFDALNTHFQAPPAPSKSPSQPLESGRSGGRAGGGEWAVTSPTPDQPLVWTQPQPETPSLPPQEDDPWMRWATTLTTLAALIACLAFARESVKLVHEATNFNLPTAQRLINTN